ncbi:hypothetical protein [Maritalea sp.]|uniref:hypothetical protein n=1 Tax=Maritalea sp. TaxID=2003361 RepID=UPI003F4A8DA5
MSLADVSSQYSAPEISVANLETISYFVVSEGESSPKLCLIKALEQTGNFCPGNRFSQGVFISTLFVEIFDSVITYYRCKNECAEYGDFIQLASPSCCDDSVDRLLIMVASSKNEPVTVGRGQLVSVSQNVVNYKTNQSLHAESTFVLIVYASKSGICLQFYLIRASRAVISGDYSRDYNFRLLFISIATLKKSSTGLFITSPVSVCSLLGSTLDDPSLRITLIHLTSTIIVIKSLIAFFGFVWFRKCKSHFLKINLNSSDLRRCVERCFEDHKLVPDLHKPMVEMVPPIIANTSGGINKSIRCDNDGIAPNEVVKTSDKASCVLSNVSASRQVGVQE